MIDDNDSEDEPLDPIKRIFLVDLSKVPFGLSSITMPVGYLCLDPSRIVKISAIGDNIFMVVEGTLNGHKHYWRNKIDSIDGAVLLQKAVSIVDKSRYTFNHKGTIWHIDKYWGSNRGLVIAEVEGGTDKLLDMPDCILEEVTGFEKYSEFNLALNPYSKW